MATVSSMPPAKRKTWRTRATVIEVSFFVCFKEGGREGERERE